MGSGILGEVGLYWEGMQTKLNIPGTLAILGATLSWATGPLFIYYLAGHLDVWSQNFWRYLVASLIWLPFLLVALGRGRVQRDLWRRALLPAVFNVVMQCLWARSLYYVEPGFVALLARTSLFWVTLFSVLFFVDERQVIRSRCFWVGLTISLLGVVLVIVNRDGFTARGSLLGIALVLTAELAWGLYTVAARHAFRGVDSRLAFSILSLYTTVGLGGLAWAFGQPGELMNLSSVTLICLVISGVVCISLAHIFYYKAINSIGPTISSVVLLLHPFLVIILSMMVFVEKLNLYQWLGGGIIVIGSVLAILSQRRT